jgi:hypothetical protein
MVIYRTTNLINGKWYIGKDEASRNYYLGSGTVLTNAIKKYGKENFKKEILEECTSKEHLSEREKYWILTTNAQNDPMSYNIASGGEGGDWTSYYPQEKVEEIYVKRGNKSDNFAGARQWFLTLSDEEKQRHNEYVNKSKRKGWYVSRVETPDIEDFVLGINEWCKDHDIDSGTASKISNPNHSKYGKASKGWRIRKADQNKLPTYQDKRIGKSDQKIHIGMTWVLDENGKRKWLKKEV